MPNYCITVKSANGDVSVTRIVEAKNQARAVAHVVEDTVTARLAEPADFMALAKAGGEIEKAQ